MESENPERQTVKDYEFLNNDDTKKENRFKRLLLVRCLREDRTMLAMVDYVNECLGEAYTDIYPSNYDDIVMNEAKPDIPICFLLSLGADPTG